MRKLTVVLPDDLFKATKVEAASQSRSLKDIVSEALMEWLEMQDDSRLLDEAMQEYGEMGGMEAHEFFRQLREEEASKRKSA